MIVWLDKGVCLVRNLGAKGIGIRRSIDIFFVDVGFSQTLTLISSDIQDITKNFVDVFVVFHKDFKNFLMWILTFPGMGIFAAFRKVLEG